MPNIKDLNVRIKSIKSTQKITQAMKLVAASKVRKVQQRVLSSRPYTQKLKDITYRIAGSLSVGDREDIPLMKQREVRSVCLIVISSDRGLCGSYNTNIVKKAAQRILELKKNNTDVKLILIGNKANNVFRRTKNEILDSFTQIPAMPTVELANLIAASAEKAFTEAKTDRVEIIGTNFISILRSEVYNHQFLPIISSEESSEKAEALYEPSLSLVLDALLPLYLSNVIFHALLEAATSELASRMNAMSNATTNAKEIIDWLTIVYNKARQAAITQEISEVVSGAEALR